MQLAGLEGVYDYLESMPVNEVEPYLRSLLGSTPPVVLFIQEYVSLRGANNATNTGASSTAARDPSADAGLPSKEPHGGHGKKAKNSRRRGRGPEKPASVPQKSFAAATVVSKKDTPKFESAADRSRAKVREYRATGKIINCLQCGFIVKSIQEDGACPSCGAALFPIDHHVAGTSDSTANASATNSNLEKYASARVGQGFVYFDADQGTWLTKPQRDAMFVRRKQDKDSHTRKPHLATIDLAGCSILRTYAGRSSKDGMNTPQEHEQTASSATGEKGSNASESSKGAFANPLLPGRAPQFVPADGPDSLVEFAKRASSASFDLTGRMQNLVRVYPTRS